MAIASNANPTALLDLVIFGGVGDLSVRKLLPALYMAHLHDNLGADTRIHALGRQSWDRGAFVAFIQEKVPAFIGRKAFNESAWDGFVQRLNYVSADVTQAIDFQALGSALQPGSDRVYYRATAPSLFTGICAHLAGAGLIDARARVVLEKPLGHDLASARRINDEVGQFFQERQIFRIDHYLGKETVQNLMVVSAASILPHPADPILTQGGLLNLDSATVDKCSQ